METLLDKLAAEVEKKEKKPAEKPEEKGGEKKPEGNGGNPFAKKPEGNGEENGEKKPAEKKEKGEGGEVEGPGPDDTAAHESAEGPGHEAAEAAEEGSVPTEGAVPAEGEEGAMAITPSRPVPVTAVIDFLQQNPNPSDEMVHQFAEGGGLDTHQLESTFYALATRLANFIRGGKSGEKQLDVSTVDPAQLEMGMTVELEHTPDAAIAKKIALDHLAEIPDYYTRLKKMEDEARGVAAPEVENLKGDVPESKNENEIPDASQYEVSS